ncbi:MAG: hypothetical protein GC168_08205 [Candidatus Hydrogenedens sp.]|nr:hypothetical protein [Candidatus Hydrogenedens sp.]
MAYRALLRVLLFSAALTLAAHAEDRYELEPIRYSDSVPDNPVERLATELQQGAESLAVDARFGYLPAILERLGVPVSSQVLVFSKTSLQRQSISPVNPRAIYFNDDVYVGTVPGGEYIELSAADPELGAVFYSMPLRGEGSPVITRETHTCLQCHATSMTNDLPGHVMRSVFTDAGGQPILKAGSGVTTQTTPFGERWGGWYVTGRHGAARHRGNTIAVETETDAELDIEAGANVVLLEDRITIDRYLAPGSDIVALMVLAHQTEMHNRFTQAEYAARMALHDQQVMDGLLGRSGDTLSASTRRRIDTAAEKVAEYMLFMGEPELEAPVSGTSGFAEEFEQAGPRDSQGRSLRDLDLTTRLFKFPLSYLVYSPQFAGLPDEMKSVVFRKLWDSLSGAVPSALTPEQRRAIVEIVRDTLPELPPYWKI